MWRQKKKKHGIQRNTFLVLKPFFAVDILQVFNIDCILLCFWGKWQLLTCVFEDDNDEKEEILLYDLIS